MKKSVIRGIKSSIVEQYPGLEDVIDEIMPKKAKHSVVKCKGAGSKGLQIVACDDVPVFFYVDKLVFPTLKVLHRCK